MPFLVCRLQSLNIGHCIAERHCRVRSDIEGSTLNFPRFVFPTGWQELRFLVVLAQKSALLQHFFDRFQANCDVLLPRLQASIDFEGNSLQRAHSAVTLFSLLLEVLWLFPDVLSLLSIEVALGGGGGTECADRGLKGFGVLMSLQTFKQTFRHSKTLGDRLFVREPCSLLDNDATTNMRYLIR